MPYKTISYDKQGAVARVMLNRPRYRNAQSRVLLEEMDEAFGHAAEDDDVRVIVLGGVGDHFSAGHDLGTPEESEDAQRRAYSQGMRGLYQRSWDLYIDKTLRWRDLPKPTIAQVQGWCIFGGWMISAAMDLIVAADDARFLPGMLQYFSIPWDLGVRKAKEILFQTRFVSAQEACELGFVNMVVPRAQLEQRTLELANSIAENDRFMLRMLKFSINQAQDVMGFSTSIRAAHSNFMLQGGRLRQDGDKAQARRLKPVDQALKKLDKPDR